MRLRRRVTDRVTAMIVPAICCAMLAYFGYNIVFGARGLFAWSRAEAQLQVQRHQLATLTAKRKALQHRISLLDDKSIDPDLLAEVARTVLSEGQPGEVDVPRRPAPENH